MNSATTLSPLGQRPKLGRAARTLGRLWQAPTFLAGLTVFLLVAAHAPFRKDPAAVQFEEEIEQLRRSLAPGREPPDILVARAERLLDRLPKFTRKSGEVHFLAGSAYFRLAESASEPRARDARAKALAHFEEAFTRGVPADDNAALFFRFGWVLLHHEPSDRGLVRAIELLDASIDKGADAPGQAYGLLVQAHLRRATPDVEAALAASRKQLERTDDRDVPAMAQARQTHAELLIRKGQRLEALKELERVGPGAPRETRIACRLLQARLCAEEGLWNRAIPIWKELLAEPGEAAGGQARIHYQLGLCHYHAEPSDEAAAAKHWEDAALLGGDEGRAAGLRLGELRFTGSFPDPARGLEHWLVALAGVRSAHDYNGSLVPLEHARAAFEGGFKVFLEGQDFRRAEQLAQLYRKLAEPGRAEQLVAEALLALANDAQERHTSVPDHLVSKKQAEVRAEFHRAAVAFEEAAMLHKAPAPLLWQAARCYLSANDNAHAVKVLDRYVAVEKDENRLAEAWYSLAEARQAMGEKEKAHQAYYKCIEYPDTVYAYRARYELAVDEMEKRKYEQARDILKQNLDNRSLDRPTHEKSIYKMAALLTEMKQYLEAAVYLKEATRQYPGNPGALVARAHLAQTYRRLAEEERLRMEASKNEDARAHYRRKRLELLDETQATYRALGDDLEQRALERELSASDQALLRLARFGEADARFAMGEYPEALRLYQGIQARGRKKFDSLVAAQRIYDCVGYMIDSPAQVKLVRDAATQAVDSAVEDLASLPADADYFTGPGAWSKDYWGERLRAFRTRLKTPAEAAGGPVIR